MNWDKLLLLLMVLTLPSHWSNSPHVTPSWSLIGWRQMNQFPADTARENELSHDQVGTVNDEVKSEVTVILLPNNIG